MATHSGVLAWRIPGTGEPGGLLSMGSHRVGHDWSNLAAATANHWFPQLRQGTCSGRSLTACVFWGWRFRTCCSRKTHLTWLKVGTWAQVTLLPLNYFFNCTNDTWVFLYKIKTELRLKWFLPPILTLSPPCFRIKETQTDTHIHPTPHFIHFTSLGVWSVLFPVVSCFYTHINIQRNCIVLFCEVLKNEHMLFLHTLLNVRSSSKWELKAGQLYSSSTLVLLWI